MILVIIGFLLDGFLASFLTRFSFFFPLFSLLSLLFCYPNYRKNMSLFVIVSTILGFCYDLVYTDTVFLNAFLFGILALCIFVFFEKFPLNYFYLLLAMLGLIICYRFFTYIILWIIGYLSFSWMFLLQGIYQSVFINFVFVSIVYLFYRVRWKRR